MSFLRCEETPESISDFDDILVPQDDFVLFKSKEEELIKSDPLWHPKPDDVEKISSISERISLFIQNRDLFEQFVSNLHPSLQSLFHFTENSEKKQIKNSSNFYQLIPKTKVQSFIQIPNYVIHIPCFILSNLDKIVGAEIPKYEKDSSCFEFGVTLNTLDTAVFNFFECYVLELVNYSEECFKHSNILALNYSWKMMKKLGYDLKTKLLSFEIENFSELVKKPLNQYLVKISVGGYAAFILMHFKPQMPESKKQKVKEIPDKSDKLAKKQQRLQRKLMKEQLKKQKLALESEKLNQSTPNVLSSRILS